MSPYITRKSGIEELFLKYIKGKSKNSYIKPHVLKVGYINKNIYKNNNHILGQNIYISTRSMMHIYQKRILIFEQIILPNIYSLLNYPEIIYENRDSKSKRGDILFIKYYSKMSYTLLACLEYTNKGDYIGYHLVTIFILNRLNYVKKLKIIWDKKNFRNGRTATPSS